jgi:hypothetical protein
MRPWQRGVGPTKRRALRVGRAPIEDTGLPLLDFPEPAVRIALLGLPFGLLPATQLRR